MTPVLSTTSGLSLSAQLALMLLLSFFWVTPAAMATASMEAKPQAQYAAATLPASSLKAASHLRVMTFYGMDLEAQAGWINVYRGTAADCSNPNITRGGTVKVLVELGDGVFTRGGGSGHGCPAVGCPRNTLFPDWRATVK